MSLTLQKLNQIRKKVKEREVLQSGNYYDLKDAEMSSSTQEVCCFRNERLLLDNDIRRVRLSVFGSKPQSIQKYFPDWAGKTALKTQ